MNKDNVRGSLSTINPIRNQTTVLSAVPQAERPIRACSTSFSQRNSDDILETGRFRFREIRLASGSEKPEDRRSAAVAAVRKSEGMAAKITQNGVGRRDVEQTLRDFSNGGTPPKGIKNLLYNFFLYPKKFFLDLVFPYECAGCGKEGILLCAECNKILTCIPPVCFFCGRLVPARDGAPPGKTCKPCRGGTRISVFLSPFSYKSVTIRNLIHALKYGRAREGAGILAHFLISYFSYFHITFPQSAVIIPVPLHKKRERFRGFNQSANIARFFSASLDISCDETIVKKNRATAPQVGLFQDKRLENVKDSFVVVEPEKVRKKCVILLDDVKTTGATLEEIARILRKAGAKEIWAVTIAH